jgi:NAD+ synthase
MQTLYATLIKELHKFAKNNQYQQAVIGLSGGLDSAIALCVASRAFGPKNLTALMLPEIGLTPNDDIEHSKILTKHFDVESIYQPINSFLVDYNFVGWEKSEQANQNIKARTRASLLRHYADAQNALFIGTANKSDLALGYGTLEGEFAGDIHPFGDIYKSELISLAKFIGLPEELMDKQSSRWIKPKQSDLDDLGEPWSKVDEILRELLEGTDPETLIQKGMQALTVHKVARLLQQNKGRFKHLKNIPLSGLIESIKRAQVAEASSM